MKAIRIAEPGGPGVLELVDVPIPVPRPREALIRHSAIGVNFVDTQHRQGHPYPIGFPLIPGVEAAGSVVALGGEVDDFVLGDRVAFVGHMSGVYAEFSCVPLDKLLRIPAGVTSLQAAAGLMQAMTAHALVYSAAPLVGGECVVVHAAAGGVGSQLVQMAKRCGATVIATVSNSDKGDAATALGADHIVLSAEPDLLDRVKSLAPDEGVDVVFDGTGRDTFDLSLDVLRPKGRLVIYGLSSGPVPLLDTNRLSGIAGATSKGSLSVSWATLTDYTATNADLHWRARDVLGWIGDGSIVVPVAHVLPLDDARRAHELIAERSVIGKIVLVPDGARN